MDATGHKRTRTDIVGGIEAVGEEFCPGLAEAELASEMFGQLRLESLLEIRIHVKLCGDIV